MNLSIDTTYKFLGDSIAGTATKNTTTNFDYALPGTYILYGAELILRNAAWGDHVSFEVIDKDNVLGYGANTILNTWVVRWYVDPNTSQWTVKSQLGGTLPAGLYIRLKYTSVSASTDVDVALNLFMITQSQ